MPYAPALLVTHSGTFGDASSPVEIWSHSLRLARPADFSFGDLPAMALAAAQSWDANWKSQLGSGVRLTRTRVAHTGADGRVVKTNGAFDQADDFTVSAGTASGPKFPLSVALCVSLETNAAGASGKGRFFLPAPPTALGDDFLWPALEAGVWADRAAAFVRAIGTSLGAVPIVGGASGTAYPVTGVRVGRVPDTMRSRRGALIEGYIKRPLPA